MPANGRWDLIQRFSLLYSVSVSFDSKNSVFFRLPFLSDSQSLPDIFATDFYFIFGVLSEFNCCVWEFCVSIMPTVHALSPCAPVRMIDTIHALLHTVLFFTNIHGCFTLFCVNVLRNQQFATSCFLALPSSLHLDSKYLMKLKDKCILAQLFGFIPGIRFHYWFSILLVLVTFFKMLVFTSANTSH